MYSFESTLVTYNIIDGIMWDFYKLSIIYLLIFCDKIMKLLYSVCAALCQPCFSIGKRVSFLKIVTLL